ncbi:MAG: hypothetical protein AB7H90_03305 [Alphaproteobacteria bacterium]
MAWKYRYDFTSWEAFLTEAAKEPLDLEKNSSREIYITSVDIKHYGTRTFDEAMELARYGWVEGRNHLFDAMANIRPTFPKRMDRFDVAGAYPFVPRHVAGDPMSMVMPGRGAIASRPVIHVNYIGGAIADVSGRAFINRGAALLSYIDALENMGYSVELTVSRRTKSKDGTYTFEAVIPLKSAGQALDIHRCAFALAHPAMHRRLYWSIQGQHPKWFKKTGTSHGQTNTDPFDMPGAVQVRGPQESDKNLAAAKLAVEIEFMAFLADGNSVRTDGFR